ncbi:MAG: carboxypeptidase M32 [Clostridiales bacterium]|nr:carboxypeptidase M32 [Clostridiales bacterium]
MNQTLEQLKEYLHKMRQYDHVLTLLSWDLSTLTPEKGVETRMSVIKFFSTEAFRLSTADEYGEMLKTLSEPEQFHTLDEPMQLTVKRYLRDYERFKRVPEEFYASYTEVKTRSERAWEKAKRAADFSQFAPHLEKVISMTKEYVHYMEPESGNLSGKNCAAEGTGSSENASRRDSYDVLLDMYEEGIDSATIDRVFGELKEGLLPLLKKIEESGRPDLSALEGTYDIEAQKKAQDMLLSYIGFDKDAGATAESEHPFTTDLCIGDVRLTNHYNESDPISAMFSAIHEGGHAIFGQNIDPAYRDTALEQVNMMGLHESQSRFYENILGRRRSFWVPIYEKLGELLPQFKEIPLDTFCCAVNDVHPSMIRTEADEVTYCLHIILRYELEKAIFRDDVPVDKLSQLWNDKMEELLGVRPQNDAEGILQDMHWSDGSFGYFPSYLLGSMYDGMFLEALEKEMGSVDTILEEGRIREITAWLNRKIHRYGSRYTSAEVLQRVCGKELSAQPLLDYFYKKYAQR